MRRLLPHPADLEEDRDLAEAYRLDGRALRVDFLASLDGATTIDGRSKGLQAPGDLRVFRMLRALADGVLVGAGTAAAEGYGPMTDDSVVGRLRIELGRPATAPIVVVSRRASVDPAGRLAVPPTVLVTCASADAGRRQALADAGVDVVVAGDDDVDLPAALDALADRGIRQITCEGGPHLLRSLLAAELVDELDLSISPALVGGEIRLVGDDPLPFVVRLDLRALLEDDGMLFARYGVRR